MRQHRWLETLPAPSAAHGEKDSGTSTHNWDHPMETSGLREAVGLDH